MDDILFGNNNQATINRLAKRSYRANKQRNVFVTIALFLTAFMITSVFSLGCSYFETYQTVSYTHLTLPTKLEV